MSDFPPGAPAARLATLAVEASVFFNTTIAEMIRRFRAHLGGDPGALGRFGVPPAGPGDDVAALARSIERHLDIARGAIAASATGALVVAVSEIPPC